MTDYLPHPSPAALHLPGLIYCRLSFFFEKPPADEEPILEAGRIIGCYFFGVTLNIPYYALLIHFGWRLLEKLRPRILR